MGRRSSPNHDWLAGAARFCETIRAQALATNNYGDFTGEDIHVVVEISVGRPNNPHAWGRLVQALLQRKLMTRNGGLRQMRRKSARKRLTPTYSWLP
jgi:hypothetical protein